MRIHLVVTANANAPETPCMVDAWSDEAFNEDPQGFRDALAREMPGAHAITSVVVDIPDLDLLALLYPISPDPIQGTISTD